MKRGPQNSYRFPIDSALPYLRSGASGEQRDREGNASMQVPLAYFGLVSSQRVMRSIVWNDSRRSSPSYEAEAFSRNAAVPSGRKIFRGGPTTNGCERSRSSNCAVVPVARAISSDAVVPGNSVPSRSKKISFIKVLGCLPVSKAADRRWSRVVHGRQFA